MKRTCQSKQQNTGIGAAQVGERIVPELCASRVVRPGEHCLMIFPIFASVLAQPFVPHAAETAVRELTEAILEVAVVCQELKYLYCRVGATYGGDVKVWFLRTVLWT